MFIYVKLTSLFDREMKYYYVTQMFKQGINTNTMCPNCILEFIDTNHIHGKYS